VRQPLFFVCFCLHGEVVFIFICVWIFVPYTFSGRLVQVWQIVTHYAHLSLLPSLSFYFYLPSSLPPVVACLASSGGCPTMYPSTYLLWTSTMYHLLLSYLYATWFFGISYSHVVLLWNSVLLYRMFGKHGRRRKTKVFFVLALFSFLKHPTQKL
jgi:hypothetical protein